MRSHPFRAPVCLLAALTALVASLPARAEHDENGCSIPQFAAILSPDLRPFINDPICNGHDNCYQHELNCGKTRAACDAELHATLVKHCKSTYPVGNPLRQQCLAAANTIWDYLYHFGDIFAAPHVIDITGDEEYALRNPNRCPGGVTNPGQEGTFSIILGPNGDWHIDDTFVGFDAAGQWYILSVVPKYHPDSIIDTPDGIVTVHMCWGQLVEVKGEWTCIE
jgi:hypothetical protein